MNNLVTCLINSLNTNIYDDISTKSTITLQENTGNNQHNNKKYHLKLELPTKWKNDKIVLIKHIERYKAHLPYMSVNSKMTKDCDYVIMNEDKKSMVFIELKDTKSCSKESLANQLLSGQWWTAHLIFCSGFIISNTYSSVFINSYFNDWTINNIVLKYHCGRPRYKRNNSHKRYFRNFTYYCFSGHDFKLENLVSV